MCYNIDARYRSIASVVYLFVLGFITIEWIICVMLLFVFKGKEHTYMKTLSYSNRFYYRELDKRYADMIKEDLRLFASMLHKTYKYRMLQEKGVNLPFKSLNKQLKNLYGTNDYFPLATIWECNAIIKASKENHKNYISRMKKKIKQMNRKINETMKKMSAIQNQIDRLILKTKEGKQTKEDYLLEVTVLKPKLKVLKNNLGQFKFRRNRFEQLSKRKLKSVCFGGKRIATIRTTTDITHEDWLKQYRYHREKIMMIPGRRQGKYSINLFKYISDEGILIYRSSSGKEDIPLKVTFHENRGLLERCVRLPHNTPGKAVAYAIEDKGEYFIIKAIIEVEEKEYTFKKENGVVGIDINKDHIALCETDRHGNMLKFKNIPMPLQNKTTNQRKHIIANSVKQVCDTCMKTEKDLVIESLDFTYKKENRMMYANKKSNQTLSEFAYKKITISLRSRCLKDAIAIRKIDPSYTSQIGKDRYTKMKGCNTHMAASYVIARRGMGLKERAFKNTTQINKPTITF